MRWFSPFFVVVAVLTAVPPADAGSGNAIGLGIRGSFQEPTSAVLAGNFVLSDNSARNLSIRPALIFGPETEARLPVTMSFRFDSRFSPFVGGGASYNVDQLGKIDPMIVMGVDVELTSRLVLNLSLNLTYQLEISDDDKELVGVLSFVF